jgi:hypothetical protein
MLENQQSVVDIHSTKTKHAIQFEKIEALPNDTSHSCIFSNASETVIPKTSTISMDTNSVVWSHIFSSKLSA